MTHTAGVRDDRFNRALRIGNYRYIGTIERVVRGIVGISRQWDVNK